MRKPLLTMACLLFAMSASISCSDSTDNNQTGINDTDTTLDSSVMKDSILDSSDTSTVDTTKDSTDIIDTTNVDSTNNEHNSNTGFIEPSNPNIKYVGRFDENHGAWWTGSSVKLKFKGTNIKMVSNLGNSLYAVIIDDSISTFEADDTLKLAENLTDDIHYVEVFKRTEANVGRMAVNGFIIDGTILPYDKIQDKKIEFIGNSITCGYGNEADAATEKFTPETENGYMTFAAITARNFDAEFSAVCFSGRGISRNLDKSTEGIAKDFYPLINPGNSKSVWDNNKSTPDVFVINLGTNDFGPGLPDSTEFCDSYSQFITTLKGINPDAYVFCLGSPMMSNSYPAGLKSLDVIQRFINSVVDGATSNGSENIYFYQLKSNSSNFGADWHPNIKQHEINAEELTDFISEKTGWEKK